MAEFKELLGLTLSAVNVDRSGDDEITFVSSDGVTFRMHHYQDCCESVVITEIIGDVADLVGTPILLAEETVSENNLPEGLPVPEYECESNTWTFYRLRTIKGSVDIRWHGSSNGYYSESVSFAKVGDA